jgi:hypothetical protein
MPKLSVYYNMLNARARDPIKGVGVKLVYVLELESVFQRCKNVFKKIIIACCCM